MMDNLRMAGYNRAMYSHERENWTGFAWDDRIVASLLGNARFAQGRLLGRLEDVGFDLSREIEAESLSAEVIASSRIEGVQLDKEKVHSSVARRLGVDQLSARADTRDVDGAVDIVLDSVGKRDDPLTAERLFSWHAALFPTGYSGLHKKGRFTARKWAKLCKVSPRHGARPVVLDGLARVPPPEEFCLENPSVRTALAPSAYPDLVMRVPITQDDGASHQRSNSFSSFIFILPAAPE